MGKLFGTDGIRGIAGRSLTPELAFYIGQAAVAVLQADAGAAQAENGAAAPDSHLTGADAGAAPAPAGGRAPIERAGQTPRAQRGRAGHLLAVVGRDTRISGDMLTAALTAGILSMGGDVIEAGVIPTPAIAYLAQAYRADLGVVISASHNPYPYNGLKFFNEYGFKLDDRLEAAIEALVAEAVDAEGRPRPAGSGQRLHPDREGNFGIRQSSADACRRRYITSLLQTVSEPLSGLRLVLDCANGAAGIVAPSIFQTLGAEVYTMGCAPDGFNINEDCGSTHPEALQAKVLAEKADAGFAFDGDGDRLIAVDHEGRIVDGDKIIAICAKALKARGELPGDLVTATVMSNLGFHKAMEAAGIAVDVTAVGDRHVLERMEETGCALGGEQSGHIIFRAYATTGDGILSALQLLMAVRRSGRRLADLSREIPVYPQVLVNVEADADRKATYMQDPVIAHAIAEMETKLAGNGRVLIRPSGTEPLIRIMLEGSDQAEITRMAEELAALMRQDTVTRGGATDRDAGGR